MKIIKFGAVWCPSCLIMRPRWQQVLKDYSSIEVIEYDYDIDEAAIEKYEIGKILPVVIFLNDQDRELTRIIGEKDKAYITDMLNKFLK